MTRAGTLRAQGRQKAVMNELNEKPSLHRSVNKTQAVMDQYWAHKTLFSKSRLQTASVTKIFLILQLKSIDPTFTTEGLSAATSPSSMCTRGRGGGCATRGDRRRQDGGGS